MIINHQNTPNFKAKFIGSTPIQKLNPKGKYEKFEAAFLEFDPANKKDFNALKDISRYWYNSQYANDICECAKALALKFIDATKNKVYILTKQNKKFEKLNFQDILGLTEIELKKNKNDIDIINIHRIQVDEELLNTIRPEFDHVGTGILNMIKEKYNKIIELNSVHSAIGFYENNGFQDLGTKDLRFRWTPETK